MTEDSQQRVELVTGSARGLGKAIAEALVDEGVALMLIDVLADRPEQTRTELNARGVRCEMFAADIALRHNCLAAVEKTVATDGRLDVLINAAGLMRFSHTTDGSEEEFSNIFQVNTRSCG